MKRKVVYLLSLILIISNSFFINCAYGTAESDQVYEVLYINSYHQEYRWAADILLGLELSLNHSKANMNLSVEYMDTKRYGYNTVLNEFHQMMLLKYKAKNFDVIVTSDDAAFNYMNSIGKEVFGETPFVFCGVNNIDSVDLEHHPKYTGVIEKADYKKTMEMAIQLHDDIETIYYITDATYTAGVQLNQLLETFVSDDVTIKRLEGDTIDEIIKSANLIEENSVILLVGYYYKNGKVYEYDESFRFFKEIDNIPIYGNQEFYLNEGLIGGYMTSGVSHGFMAGEMALSVLSGKSPSKIPINDTDFNELWINYQVLEKHGVSLSKLPTDVQITNYNAHGKKTIGILFSTNNTSVANQRFEEGLADTLIKSGYEYVFAKEYLDIEKANDVQHLYHFFNMMQNKYSNIPIDAVASYGDDAYDFLEQYNRLVDKYAHVFSGVSKFPKHHEDGANITGDVERYWFNENVDLALELFPDMKEMIFIVDNTDKGLALQDKIMNDVFEYNNQLDFSIWNNLGINELEQSIAELDEGSIIFYVHYTKDNQNNVYFDTQGFEIIERNAKVPIIVFDDEYVGIGALGGKVISSYQSGKQAGEKMIRVLEGEHGSSVPISITNNTRYYFDSEILEKYNVDVDLIPDNSTIINQPIALRTFLKENPIVMSLSIVIVVALVMIIALLAVYIRYKSRVQKRINYYATIDALTKTYNRRKGFEVLEGLIQEAKSNNRIFTICYFDINNLKYVNDKFGHISGDELITTITNAFKMNIREGDTISRLGGDEFVVAFPDIHESVARTIVDRIESEIEQINLKGEHGFEISFSKGFVEYSIKKEMTVANMIDLADERMYKDKFLYKESKK